MHVMCVCHVYACVNIIYRSLLVKHPLLGKRPCNPFQGATVAASKQMYGILIPGKHPCGPKSQVMFKCPWALTQDTTTCVFWFFSAAINTDTNEYEGLHLY